jgi:hypothetical protein
MRTFYFDMKDGVPIRDRVGLQFPTAAGAIEHSKSLHAGLATNTRSKIAILQ